MYALRSFLLPDSSRLGAYRLTPMLQALANWFVALPESQQAVLAVAFLTLLGVILTAFATTLTAKINAGAAIQTRNLVNQHEHRQWLREKTWSAYAESLDRLTTMQIGLPSVYLEDLIDFCLNIDKLLQSKYPNYKPGVHMLFTAEVTENPSDLFDSALRHKEAANKAVLASTREKPLVNTAIFVDAESAEVHDLLGQYSKEIGDYFNKMFSEMDSIVATAHKCMAGSVDQPALNDLSAKVEMFYSTHVMTTSNRPSSTPLRLLIASKMRNL